MERIFKSAITRGGSIFRPDIIIIDQEAKILTYKKRDPILFTADTFIPKRQKYPFLYVEWSQLSKF